MNNFKCLQNSDDVTVRHVTIYYTGYERYNQFKMSISWSVFSSKTQEITITIIHNNVTVFYNEQ